MQAAIYGFEGLELTADERAFFRDSEPAGFILFKRNCGTQEQLQRLTDSLRDLTGRDDVPILIDQEGGRVARMKPPEWPAFPAAERFADHRRAIAGGDRSLAEVCAAERLRLAVDGMHYVSRWITPEGAPRRFDTRFFVGVAPERQTPLHDAEETIAHEWVRPLDALARYREGSVDLMTPTERSLQWLSSGETVADVLEAAAVSRPRGNYQRG